LQSLKNQNRPNGDQQFMSKQIQEKACSKSVLIFKGEYEEGPMYFQLQFIICIKNKV